MARRKARRRMWPAQCSVVLNSYHERRAGLSAHHELKRNDHRLFKWVDGFKRFMRGKKDWWV